MELGNLIRISSEPQTNDIQQTHVETMGTGGACLRDTQDALSSEKDSFYRIDPDSGADHISLHSDESQTLTSAGQSVSREKIGSGKTTVCDEYHKDQGDGDNLEGPNNHHPTLQTEIKSLIPHTFLIQRSPYQEN